MRKHLVGWRFIKDAEVKVYPKMRIALDALKTSKRVLTIDELAVKMGYAASPASRKAVIVTVYRLKDAGLAEPVTEMVEGPVAAEMRLLVEGSTAVKTWMRRLTSEGTKEKFLFVFTKYFQWVKTQGTFATPDAMLDHKQSAVNDKERFLHITLVEGYLTESKLPVNQKKSVYIAVRSFYKHNKAALPSYPLKFTDKGFRAVVQEPITLEEIRQLLETAKPREKAMYLIMLQGGLDRATFTEYFNLYAWPQICKQLGSETPDNWDLTRVPVRVDLVRVKTGKQYYSFISTDAVKALQAWMNIRQSLTGTAMRNGEPIFITLQKTPVTKDMMSGLFNRLAIRSGLEVRKFGKPSEVRYRFHPHELRDTFRTACTVAGIAFPVCEFLIGHEIDKLHYDKSPDVYPEHFRNEYLKVESYVNVFSSQAVGIKKLGELEAKISEKDKVIESLVTNGQTKASEIQALKDKVDGFEKMINGFYEAREQDRLRAIKLFREQGNMAMAKIIEERGPLTREIAEKGHGKGAVQKLKEELQKEAKKAKA
jgi:integrase